MTQQFPTANLQLCGRRSRQENFSSKEKYNKPANFAVPALLLPKLAFALTRHFYATSSVTIIRLATCLAPQHPTDFLSIYSTNIVTVLPMCKKYYKLADRPGYARVVMLYLYL